MTDEALASPPRANPDFVGHEAAEVALRLLVDSGRLPHALLLSGPRGIGKATLAFRLARFVLAGAGEGAPLALFGAPVGSPADPGLAISPESGVFRRVAAGGHADLLTVERAFDPRRKRLRSEIVVDDVREIGAFLHLTAAEGGWRVVIVDGADAMNRNAGNALLKILEEPPRRTLLVLVAHSPGKLLPTSPHPCVIESPRKTSAPWSSWTCEAHAARRSDQSFWNHSLRWRDPAPGSPSSVAGIWNRGSA